MKQNGMVLNGRKVLLNPTVVTETGPHTFNDSVIYGTHNGEMVGRGKGNEEMA